MAFTQTAKKPTARPPTRVARRCRAAVRCRLLWYGVALLLSLPALAARPDAARPDAALDAARPDAARPDAADGQVTVPLADYAALWQHRQQPAPPVAYALGRSQIQVSIRAEADGFSAEAQVDTSVEVFADRWTLVPLLAPGVALHEASIDGRPVALVHDGQGLAWPTDKAATVALRLRYSVPARRAERGYLLALPVPAAPGRLGVEYPGEGVEMAIVPAARQRSDNAPGLTRVSADIPATAALSISWRPPGGAGHALSRASYRGELTGEAVLWHAAYQVQLFDDETLRLPLLDTGATLVDVRVDGEAATVLAERGRFVVLLKGRGRRQLEVSFQVPVRRDDGPPQVVLRLPPVPMAELSLSLPGDKDLRVTPGANVVTRRSGDTTVATLAMPMAERMTLSWTDAVPQDLQTRLRASAIVYHALHAEEGVLYGRASVVYEIARGEAKQLALSVPAAVEVNGVRGDGVADWSVAAAENGRRALTVFLERAVRGRYLLEIAYERLLGADAREPFIAPLLQALEVQRQRGMVALLTGAELTLQPADADGASAVGENQLPTGILQTIERPVAHTYKYIALPELRISALPPQRRQGKFNAQVDTLLSIGDVTLSGSATVDVTVKSGAIMALQLRLPADLNVLGVTGPALRSQQISAAGEEQRVELEFNRELDGQFRVELSYERIMADRVGGAPADAGGDEIRVPRLSVTGAEVEHGRIAVEALTAVEVRPARARHLSGLDVNELPQHLLLKTSNPILLAYKYVRAEAPFELALQTLRHQEVELQLAAIERAHYRTLYTRDGLAVTTARFIVRNNRRQFLRLTLPPASRVWSAAVDGRAEKPARVGGESDALLLKLRNAADSFPVDIIYATQAEPMGAYGAITTRLPQPDMVATQSRWDLYLPARYRYLRPDGDLNVLTGGRYSHPRAGRAAAQVDGLALRIDVPAQGVHFAFEKLYANQTQRPTTLSIPYLAAGLGRLSWLLSGFGTLLFWLAVVALWQRPAALSARLSVLCLLTGLALLALTLVYLQVDPTLAALLTAAVVVLIAALDVARRLRRRRSDASTTPDSVPP